jgi:hypothetical protein
MAPPAAIANPTQSPSDVDHHIKVKASTTNRLDAPLQYSGSLNEYKSFDVTPVIGREFPNLQITDILNDDTKIRDLAILGRSTCGSKSL